MHKYMYKQKNMNACFYIYASIDMRILVARAGLSVDKPAYVYMKLYVDVYTYVYMKLYVDVYTYVYSILHRDRKGFMLCCSSCATVAE